MKRAEITVSGTVQRVGFRYHVRELAQKLSLTGNVKNLTDGTVAIVCEGQQQNIDALVEKIRALKPPTAVEDVQIRYSDIQGLKSFEIILGDIVEEMSEGFATGAMYMDMMLNKQDKMENTLGQVKDTLGQTNETVGQMNDTVGQMNGKLGRVLDKQDQATEQACRTNDEIRNLSSTLASTMDSRFQKLEKEISEIKARLAN